MEVLFIRCQTKPNMKITQNPDRKSIWEIKFRKEKQEKVNLGIDGLESERRRGRGRGRVGHGSRSGGIKNRRRGREET